MLNLMIGTKKILKKEKTIISFLAVLQTEAY